jgi:hypothetical protein
VHRDVAAEFGVAAGQIEQDTDLAATVDVVRQRALRLQAREPAHVDVLADLADQRGAGGLDRAFAERQRRQRGDVGRVPARHQRGEVLAELDEVVVLRDEVGFRVDLDDRAELAGAVDVDRDHALRGDAGSGLRGLVAQLDAQDLLGLGQVAAGLGQRLLALHHRRVGLVAQFLHHRSGDFRH